MATTRSDNALEERAGAQGPVSYSRPVSTQSHQDCQLCPGTEPCASRFVPNPQLLVHAMGESRGYQISDVYAVPIICQEWQTRLGNSLQIADAASSAKTLSPSRASERIACSSLSDAKECERLLDGQVPEAPFVGIAIDLLKGGVGADLLGVGLELAVAVVQKVICA